MSIMGFFKIYFTENTKLTKKLTKQSKIISWIKNKVYQQEKN